MFHSNKKRAKNGLEYKNWMKKRDGLQCWVGVIGGVVVGGRRMTAGDAMVEIRRRLDVVCTLGKVIILASRN